MAKIKGREALLRKIAALPPVTQKALTDAQDKSAIELTTFQQALVPRRTGALAGSIMWRRVDPLIVEVSAGGREAWYARIVESIRPFFWPAYRALRSRIKNRSSRAISKALKEVAAR